MKKLMIYCVAIMMMVALTACGQASDTSEKVAGVEEKGSFSGITGIPSFEVVDINDNVVTDSILQEKGLTLINIWGTFCSPCIEELPMLQEIADSYEDKDVNVIGIVADGDTNEVKAFDMLNKLEIKFTNLIPNEAFQRDFVSKATAVPVTLLVNNKGEILEILVGAREKNVYTDLIEKYLSQAE